MLIFGENGKAMAGPLLWGRDGICDLPLGELNTCLCALQVSVANLENSTSWDEGARESIDYLVGVGFVAAQKYMGEIRAFLGASYNNAADVGPKFRGRHSVERAVHAAANQWKHWHEWDISNTKDKRPFKTMDSVFDSLSDGESVYPCANILFAICGSMDLARLGNRMEEWRDELIEHVQWGPASANDDT